VSYPRLTTCASSVELHNSILEGDVMRMRQLDAIEVPGNKAVMLQPGGMHIHA
jgi:copper(I)-binding protein